MVNVNYYCGSFKHLKSFNKFKQINQLLPVQYGCYHCLRQKFSGRLNSQKNEKSSLTNIAKNPKKLKSDTLTSPSNNKKRYTDSLNLPQTSFPLSLKNGAAAKREEEIQKSNSFQSLYQWQRRQDWPKEFVLHDGPPYANGKPHVGHVVNKVLKDITNRYKVMKRHKVHYVPGWDCHGMPIETKAVTDGAGKFLKLNPLELRARAKQYAEKVLTEQKKAFQRWGVMADWTQVYKTLTPDYEAAQLKVFYQIYEKGYMYRDYMPVYWSTSSHSALAEAELEYKTDHISKSVYVQLRVTGLSDQIRGIVGGERQVYAVVWTTTPWTLPFNRAVCYNPNIKYVLLEDETSHSVYICEEQFVEKLKSLLPCPLQELAAIEGSSLQGSTYQHPLTNVELQLLPSSHVTSGKGTGLVHISPAHGHEDFSVALQYSLPTECHVDEQGTYTSGVDANLLGKTVGVDADDAVLDALGPQIVKVENVIHRFPYDWRTKKPVIIRASKQWFIDVPRLRPLALDALSKVNIIPPNSENGMVAELMSRPYWCISRQRTWGVPMPIFYHKLTGQPLITRETVDHVVSLVKEQGSDCWWRLSTQELLPDQLLTQINRDTSDVYEKGQDILDIWFDSGVSWASVLKDVGGRADVYLEGNDQFKGWFQTSLLTSVAVNGRAPFRQLITHGFATDEEGKKMSKSVGNVVDPEEVINGGQGRTSYGADVLRWWVAHYHQHQQITLGPSILQQLQEDLFKVRKCLRHLLGNLYDFQPDTDSVTYNRLTAMDKYMLFVLYGTIQQIDEAYDSFSFHQVVQLLQKFFYSDLSSLYFNCTKDRCYCDAATGEGRRSSQTVQFYITRFISAALAPIVPHLAEEVHQHIRPNKDSCSDQDSVFKVGWLNPPAEWNDPAAAHQLLPVFDMRRSLYNILGAENPLDYDIHIYSSPTLHNLLRDIQPEVTSAVSSLCEIFQTSHVSVLDSPPAVVPEDSLIVEGSTVIHCEDSTSGQGSEVDYKIVVSTAMLNICERCRRYTAKSYSSPCDRCLSVLAQAWSH